MEDNIQLPWTGAYRVSSNNDRVWAFRLKSASLTPNYKPGDLIGIKSKCCGVPTSCSYFFRDSREIMFERVRWTRQSRGVFRLSTNDVTIRDCEIVREAPIHGLGWCLSTSDGGPQFGQPKDTHVHKVRVENFYAENTGDDALAFFNVKVRQLIKNSLEIMKKTVLYPDCCQHRQCCYPRLFRPLNPPLQVPRCCHRWCQSRKRSK